MTPLSVFSVNLISEDLLLLCSILVFAAVLVTKLGSRFGVPSLLLFLILGMAVGQDGLGLHFEDYEIADHIGHFAMSIILLTAGLETSFKETKPVFRQGLALSVFGVLLTVALTGGFTWLVAGKVKGVSVLVCFLLAAIMGSTDSASVFSLLRDKKLHLREHLGPMLELESGSNDPIAYMLTIIVVKIITNLESMMAEGTAVFSVTVVLVFVLQIVVGIAIGFCTGYASKWIMGKLNLESYAMTSILILSLAFFTSGVTGFLHGNGLLALYIAAIIMGNKAPIRQRKETLQFFDGLTWLMQLMMFLVLGLLARPASMLKVLGPAALIGLFLIFVARPVSVFTTLLPFRKMSFRSKLFTSWVGIKGAGPILFAIYPLVNGVSKGSEIFNIVFIITLMSLLIQGMTLTPMARWLRLSYDEDPEAETFGMEIPEEMGMLRDHIVTEEDLAGGGTLRELGLPHGIRVMMVRRGERFLVPHGSMALEAGDRLVIIMGESDD